MTTSKAASAQAPIVAPGSLAFASSYLGTYGHGVVVVVRGSGAKVESATFIVDAHCMGIRRATCALTPAATFRNKVLPALHAEHHTVPVPVDVALGIVTGAAAFAKAAGFAPALGYNEALTVFGGIEPKAPDFKFGKAGKPHFHPMPGDGEEFAEEILGKLRRAVGPHGFTYDLDELDEDHLDGDDDAELGEDGYGADE